MKIHSWLLQNIFIFNKRLCDDFFTTPYVFIQLVHGTTFLEHWEISTISLVFKKDEKICITNYRPIKIKNNFAKVFEMIFHEYLYSIFSRYISPHQHGFIKGRSTVSNLTTNKNNLICLNAMCHRLIIFLFDFFLSFC